MTDGTQRARDSDRNRAIEAVKAATLDGQIVEMDRDVRIEQIRNAQTLGDVELVVRDLQPPRAFPTEQPPPAVPYGPGHQSESEPAHATQVLSVATSGSSAAGKGCAVLLVVFVVGILAVGSFFALAVFDAVDSPFDSTFEDFDQFEDFEDGFSDVATPQAAPEVLTRRGYDDLLAALRKEQGDTMAFQAVLYPGYASLDVPAETSGQRQLSLYYDGDLSESLRTTSTYDRFDLARVEFRVIDRALRRAEKALGERPETTYAIIRAPGLFDTTSWVTAYATSEFNETAYVAVDIDGKVVRILRP